jgi:uncharacterized membrane protein
MIMFYWSFWGMNAFWWFFWVILMVAFFSTLTPIPRSRAKFYEEPLATLRRRYARSELTTSEFEERREVLLRTAETGTSEPRKPRTTGGPSVHGSDPSHGRA